VSLVVLQFLFHGCVGVSCYSLLSVPVLHISFIIALFVDFSLNILVCDFVVFLFKEVVVFVVCSVVAY